MQFKHANTFEPGDAVRVIRSRPGEKIAAEHCEGQVTGFSGGQFEVKLKSGATEYVSVDKLTRI